MRLVLLSDTHTYHYSVNVPDGDVVIHCGDFSSSGKERQYHNFINWFSRLPHQHKIFVAGNHDWFCYYNRLPKYNTELDVHYLQDDGCIIDGIKFYGSPWQPEFCNWAFNLPPLELQIYWSQIPDDTNVLITHGPPLTILDSTEYKDDIGCGYLLDRVKELNHLKLHAFGHIHDSYGIKMLGKKTFVNAAICTEQYEALNEPIVIDI